MSLPTTMLTADEFMARVGSLPHSKRLGFATKVALENDPQLPILIQQLLATTALPSRIPYPDVPDDSDTPQFIDLQFSQTTASKSFVQRELGLAMATAVGRPALPILMEALLHPSIAGKAKVVAACVKYAPDEQLLHVYHRCVPAVQVSLKESLSKADRRELLASLGVPPRPAQAIVEPELAVLERTLTSCAEYQREDAWNKTTLGSVWPSHHLHNPQYISEDSPLNLVEKLFELLAAFPPTRSGFKSTYKLPSAISSRFLSFLKMDLPRSLSLVTRLCHWIDDDGKQHISFPESFAEGRYYLRFWHGLDLQTQRTHVEPFIANLLELNNGALLKSGQLGGLNLLGEVRWPVVYSIAIKAIALLKDCKVAKERPNVIAFILGAIKTLHARLVPLATIDSTSKRNDQSAIEKGTSELIAHTIKHFLVSLTATEKSDEEIVSKLQSMFLKSSLGTIDHYHTLVKILFESVRGVFSMQHVSAGLLQGLAPKFLDALTPKTRNVYTIPNYGVTQPYSNLPSGDNDCIFQVVLSLWPPREHLSFYTSYVCPYLSTSQKDHVWTMLNDPEYFVDSLGIPASRHIALSALKSFPPSPSARHAIILQTLLSDGTDQIILPLYALCDISDPAARVALTKMTYTRLFEERLEVYRTLINATQTSNSVREFITTMKFFVPRIKNEIPPDAGQLPFLFSVPTIIDLLRRATDEEAAEIASVYVAWENQVNEAVSPIPAISSHILSIVNYCLSIFAANPSGVFFQMALQILWARCLNEHGLSKAKVQFVTRSAHHTADTRNEADELAFRRFLATVDKDADYGFWRVQDEAAYVDFMYRQNQKIYEPQTFDGANATYPAFIQAMLGCLGTRWCKVPRIRDYVEQQMDIIRGAKGTGDLPSEWDKNPVHNAVQFISGLQRLYRGTMDESPLPWWTEFRDLRLLSSSATEEMNLRWSECRDEKGTMDLAKLDALVGLLLHTDDTAVYVHFVSQHLINVRQDLLLDRFITTGKYGVFNPPPSDYVEGDRIEPASWDFHSATRFSPHQCEVFAEMLLNLIRSNEFPLHTRVRATEQFTKLPTTTIHELAALLTQDDLNPRISEAILMFLPHLDEPAAGIQFLLAPAILAGELARTAVYSVKRSLEHVPLASVPTLLEAATAKPLKIGAFKELVRIITTYIKLPEMQDLVKRLWDRPLHQDVRIALLQSILPALDSPHQDLAWYIIDKATDSLSTLQADDTLFVLLAVTPEVSTTCVDDVLRTYLPRSPVLADMATVTIPKAHCERYVETVLWPLTQIRLNTDLAESIKADKKKSAELAERIPLIRSSSYIACFDLFVGPNSAVSFAERAAKDSRELVDVGLESYKPGNNFGSLPEEQLFLYLTECIGRCVAQNEKCWKFLLEAIDFLASRVAHFQHSPAPQGHRSIKQLQAFRLADNFLFHSSEFLCLKVTHDRMELLKPLAKHGVEDFFAATIYLRRFNLFSKHLARVSRNGTGEDILPEARALLAENIKLSHSCHHTFEKGIANLVDLLYIVPSASISVIRREILAGDHGVAEAPWVNSIQLRTLEKTYTCAPSYAKELGTFHAHVATQQPTFYQQNYASFDSLIRKVLNDSLAKKSQLGSYEAFRLLVEPVIQRQRQSNNEEEGDMIINLFKGYPYHFFTSTPECAQSLIQDALMCVRPGKSESLARAREMVALLIRHVTWTGQDSASFPAAFFLETIYSGNFLSLVLDQSTNSGDATLSFPYFFGSGDPSGGDIEDRSAKSTVAAVQVLYDGWKARHALSFTQKTGDKTSTYSSSTALLVVLDTYKTSPKLILANPGLFFSCLCLSLSDADLHSYSTKLFSSLREVLTPLAAHKKSAKWVPPAELTLSFAHKMLVELPDEVSDAVVGAFNVGVTESKLEAVSLLIWWAETFFSSYAGYTELVNAEGRERLLGLYEELRVLAIGDGDAIVRVTALEKLCKASDFVGIPAL
ncbi:hypothetical protein DFH07DRAFT_841252 [Mycena maculata]|uniref:Uncharacterized protein n=1 Tax=Mycena maculata TaxID=230809 RepID=A0AAD7IBM9_9AGAR|nr:hypothetical protein DFH07DRAFT_841252 [Mycena maculata]